MNLLNNNFSQENITSDVYEYTWYLHDCAMPSTSIKLNNCYSEPQDSIKHQLINAQDFTPSDLELFVDSIEIIAHLEKSKHQRRQKLKIKQLQKLFETSKRAVSCWDATMIFTSYDEEAIIFDYKTLCDSSCHDTLFNINENSLKLLSSAPVTGEESGTFLTFNYETNNNQSNSVSPHQNSSKAIDLQEPEESGIYLNNGETYHFYEEIDLIRARSEDVSHSAAANKQLPCASIREEAEYSEIYECVPDKVSQLRQLSKKSKTAKKRKRLMKSKRLNSQTNQKFLDKAMRFLSL